MCIRDRHIDYANQIADILAKEEIRLELDTGDDTIGKKLRTHRSMRPAYIMILGDEEQNNGTVSFLDPDREQTNGLPMDDFISKIKLEIKSRK